MKVPPPPDIIDWAKQDIGANIQPLTSEDWAGLLKGAGLAEILVRIYTIKLKDEERGLLQRYGWGGMFGVMGRMLLLYLKSPAYRKFVKEASKGGITPKNLEEYFGYGLFVGKK